MPTASANCPTPDIEEISRDGSPDEPGNEPAANAKTVTFPRKILQAVSSISVEVSALLYVAAASGCRLIYQQLLLEKCCRFQLGYAQQVCDHLDDPANMDAENASQKLAARYNMYDSLIEYVIPVFVALFIGNWTDKHGRKVMIVFCFVTTVVQQCGFILNVVNMSWDPIYISVMASLPVSLGAFTTFFMLVFSYLGDVTTESQRTLRMAVLNLFLYSGQPLGNLAGARIFELYGYNMSFCFFIGVAAFGGIYSAVRLDSDAHNRKKVDGSTPGGAEDSDEARRTKHSFGRKFKDLMNVNHNFRETFRTFFRRRQGNRRMVLILLGVSLLVGLFPIYGEFNVDFLYVKKRLGWSVTQISYYNTYKIALQIFGTLTFTPLVKLVLKWEDTKIGGFCVCFQAFSRLVHAFATTPWMFYLSGALYMLSTVKSAITRSIISKVVEPREFGKAYAVVGFSEAFIPMVAGVAYAESYRATVDSFPGTPYLISAAAWVITGIIYVFVHFAHDEYGSSDLTDSKIVNECDGDAESRTEEDHPPNTKR